MKRYCVIGAGAAGISALYELREAGYEVDCYEKTDRVGGHWHTDYDALHLITPRDSTHFRDFPMPEHYPLFPRRDQVREYLESYAVHHDLYSDIQFNRMVQAVRPRATEGTPGSSGWSVTLNSGEKVEYDGVLVANGHLWDPKVPEVPGEFTGKQIHSGFYRNTDDIEGDRVLVVGAGNSGCDLAVDAAQHRIEVDIVVRKGIHFQPKTYFGMPRQAMPWLQQFTADEQDFIARMLAKVSLGDWWNYPGLPEPEHRTLAEGRTTVNDLLLYWIHHGRVRVVPSVERFDGNTVYFSDGSSDDYETILWATGFHSTIPFISDGFLETKNNVPLRYAGGIIPKGLEKLYCIGLTAPRGPQLPIYGTQAQLVLQMLQLHDASLGGCAELSNYLGQIQQPDDRIDIVRHIWQEQIDETGRLLQDHPASTHNVAAL